MRERQPESPGSCLRIGIAIIALLICGPASAGLLWPPKVAVPPVTDQVFHDVTLVEPGERRVPHATLALSGGRIASIDLGTGHAVGANEQLRTFFAARRTAD